VNDYLETNPHSDYTICCEVSWGRGSTHAFISSYSIDSYSGMGAGLSLVDATSGILSPLVVYRGASGPYGGIEDMRFMIKNVFEKDDGTLLGFAAISNGARTFLQLQTVKVDGSITPVADLGAFNSTPQEVLWARDGSGVLGVVTGSPDGRDELYWVSSRNGEIQQLPIDHAGRGLRWGPEMSQGERRVAAKSERAEIILQVESNKLADSPSLTDADPRMIPMLDLKVRSGPGSLYPVVGTLPAQQVVGIVGVSFDGRWWQVAVSVPEESDAWVLGDSTFVVAQNTDAVPFTISPPPPPPLGRIFFPDWGSDRRAAIFSTELTNGSVPQLLISDTDQVAAWNDEVDKTEQAAQMPDGQTFVFMSEERDGNWEIYSRDIQSGVVTRLTNNPAIDQIPVVSPDGRQVAFVSSRGGVWGVWVVPIGGGTPERVVRINNEYLLDYDKPRMKWTQ